ncbi:MAG TPA: permease [Bacillota bacterium]|nr:permease [Bacillota bacterium]
MKLIKRYWIFLAVVLVDLVLVLARPTLGQEVVRFTIANFREMLFILPPVFILLGLMDVWVPRETMTRYMGENSGAKGAALSIFMGAAAAGPLYGAFPIAVALTRKGASLHNVLLFIGSWSTLKIPMFLFETGALGAEWSLTRWGASLVGIFVIAFVMEKLLNSNDRVHIQTIADGMSGD